MQGPDGRQIRSPAQEWAETYVASGDLAEEVAKLKAQDGKPIIAHGGASFARSLIARGLVDQFALLTHPVALGKGLPVFSDLANPRPLKLVNSKVFPAGAVAQIYRPAEPVAKQTSSKGRARCRGAKAALSREPEANQAPAGSTTSQSPLGPDRRRHSGSNARGGAGVDIGDGDDAQLDLVEQPACGRVGERFAKASNAETVTHVDAVLVPALIQTTSPPSA